MAILCYFLVSLEVDGYIARRFASQSSLLGSVLDPLADKCLVSVLFVTLTMVDLIPCQFSSCPHSVPTHSILNRSWCNDVPIPFHPCTCIVPLTVLILTRDGLLIAGGFYLRYTTLPPPVCTVCVRACVATLCSVTFTVCIVKQSSLSCSTSVRLPPSLPPSLPPFLQRTWSRYWDIQRSTLQVTPSLLSKVNTGLQLLLVGLSLGAPVVGVVGHPALQALW